MPFIVFFRPLSILAVSGLAALTAFGAGLELESEAPLEYDHERGEFFADGKARLTYEGMLLTANQIVYNQAEQVATARGDVTVTGPNFRAVGEELRLHVADSRVEGDEIRAGFPPFFVSADSLSATSELYEFGDGVFHIGEPQPFGLNVRARSGAYYPQERVEVSNVTLRVGRQPIFYVPRLQRTIAEPPNNITFSAGHSRHLGFTADAGARFPVFPSVALGADAGYYTRRGFLAGPGTEYSHDSADHRIDGSFFSGYISDQEDPGLDRLERPIDRQRYFGEWRHKHFWDEQMEITASFSGWSDSEALRDFRPDAFSTNQFPDNYLEATYLQDNSIVSAFMRGSPNDFQVIQERLPEIRYDYLPRPLGGQLVHRFHGAATALREDRPHPFDDLPRSDRLDAYYQLSRPITATDWLTLTPVAGGRVTHYERPLADREAYTRVLGEVGFDADFYAYGIYDYENRLWEIDGIRHIVNPKVQYRFIPEADRGEEYIPPIDRRVFMTRLEPVSLGWTRNIDELGKMHTFRYGLNNIFQTRHEEYGSQDLLTFYLANDLRFSRESGENLVSDIHAEAVFTPIYWLRLDGFSRMDSSDADLREYAAGFTLTDARYWSLRLGGDYLEDFLEQYSATYYRRLNDVFGALAEVRYDANLNRFTRQTYSLIQNIHQTWQIEYQVFFRSGAEREGSTGVGLSISYLAF